MKWSGRRQSGNVEDRRGMGGRGLAVGGGGIVAVIITLVVLFLGGDPGTILDQNQGSGFPTSPAVSTLNPQEEELKQFAAVVLADTEDVWTEQFRLMGDSYRKPFLVLYSRIVQTPSGFASAASGPFYSPQDERIYLDLSFFQELTDRFGAPGDFAQAYVVAHEVGHHVQKLLGILDQVTAAQSNVSEAEASRLSVALELQADFLAGVWAYYAQTSLGVVEPGDIEEALGAASSIGDDRLQMEAQGYVTPDSFTHGTSEQRVRWFKLGFDTGDLSRGDTFSANPL
ncbi:MAG TPA: neutral zinc metallopeptidase [Thermoleophilia bacterium]|nr:neutral zinc metallopeptidase [Thermoleophilia bacterium]